jgi:membrane-bound metal-dependent hydrolase YbcI (DUF457 family)
MPLTPLHAIAGAAAGAAYYAAETAIAAEPLDPEALTHAAVIGGIAGAMPDILEPPFNRYHRSVFHSFAAVTTAVSLFGNIDSFETLDPRTKKLARAALAAYLSHLALDAGTPVGLPVLFDLRGIGRKLFT